jgi:nucleoside-diphosphate-sugar epimerase
VKTVVVLGGRGFVGSAFVRRLEHDGAVRLRSVHRDNYAEEAGKPSDVVIDCSGNSRKYLGDEDPRRDFDLSVTHRLRTLQDFPASLQVHVSSVDVYSELHSQEGTRENVPIDVARLSNYGFHKLLAEQVVRHYAPRWLIVRLAGMVGPGLKKNPVYDIVHGKPLRIHPDSRYQFLHTDDVANVVLALVEAGLAMQVYNVCGAGLISPRDIARLAQRELDLSRLAHEARPRVVDVNVDKLQRQIGVPTTDLTVRRFVQEVLAEAAPS